MTRTRNITSIILLGLLFSVLLWSGLIKIAVADAPDAATVLARVEAMSITVADLQKHIIDGGMYSAGPAGDRQRLEKMLDDDIFDRLVGLEAGTVSLKGRADFLVRLRRAQTSLAGKLYGEDHIRPRLQMDSATVDSFYHNHISRYSTSSDQWKIRHITVFLPGKGVPVGMTTYVDSVYNGWDPKRKIDSIYTRLAHGEDFSMLARVHSEDPKTRGSGGSMGWVSRQFLPSGPFADSCEAQPIHHISHPFPSPVGWHIIQVMDKRPAGPVPLQGEILDDVIAQLTGAQSGVLARAISDSLMKAGSFDLSPDAASMPDGQLRPETPLAIVNGQDTIYAADYLQDRLGLIQQQKLVDSVSRHDQIAKVYYKRACWYTMLRSQGYLDRPEIGELTANLVRQEQKDIVQLSIADSRYEPDKTAIENYYRTHPAEFQSPPRTLQQATERIRQSLKSRHEEEIRNAWVKAASSRHHVIRYTDRLALVHFLAQ